MGGLLSTEAPRRRRRTTKRKTTKRKTTKKTSSKYEHGKDRKRHGHKTKKALKKCRKKL